MKKLIVALIIALQRAYMMLGNAFSTVMKPVDKMFDYLADKSFLFKHLKSVVAGMLFGLFTIGFVVGALSFGAGEITLGAALMLTIAGPAIAVAALIAEPVVLLQLVIAAFSISAIVGVLERAIDWAVDVTLVDKRAKAAEALRKERQYERDADVPS